jgi:AcrR family transcriptional regulator
VVEFAEKGFHAANVSAIASRANVSQGTIYWYYESKKALFLELVAAVFEEVVSPLDRILGNTDLSPLDRLRQVFRTSLTLSRGNTGKLRLLLNLWSQPALFDREAEETLLLDRIYRDQILAVESGHPGGDGCRPDRAHPRDPSLTKRSRVWQRDHLFPSPHSVL